jgi:hypothetical protein
MPIKLWQVCSYNNDNILAFCPPGTDDSKAGLRTAMVEEGMAMNPCNVGKTGTNSNLPDDLTLSLENMKNAYKLALTVAKADVQPPTDWDAVYAGWDKEKKEKKENSS